MGQVLEQYATKRRFPRVHGPFYGYCDTPQTPVLVYDLNLGGGLVNFGDHQPDAVAFALHIVLPNDGMIRVHAETVYLLESGVAVRFVDVDSQTRDRLARTVTALLPHQPPAN